MNKQTTLEDEEALDAIEDIWQEERLEADVADGSSAFKYKLKTKTLTRPYVAYEPLNNNCDSLTTWSVASFHFMQAQKIKFKLFERVVEHILLRLSEREPFFKEK